LFAIFFMVAIIAAFRGVKQKRAIPARRELCSTAAPAPAIRPHVDAPNLAIVPRLEMFFAEETRHADEFSGEECAQVDSGFGIQGTRI
jgi:hypothetical protein